MRVTIFTQDEHLYLPTPIGFVVEALTDQVACIVLFPTMLTHGGIWSGMLRHLAIFGFCGAVNIARRIAVSKIFPVFKFRPRKRKYWSTVEIGRLYNIPTYHIGSLKSREVYGILDRHPADLLVSVSCPQIIQKEILHRFKHGGINVHSGDLPKYRGIMPTYWALLQSEKRTAVTVHYLTDKVDNGAILAKRYVKINQSDSWDKLIRKTKGLAGPLLLEVIEQIKNGTISPQPNEDCQSTYYSFPTAEDARRFRANGRRLF